MAKIQAVWAIDIGQAALKALKLVPGETPEQVVAEAFDYIEYPKILSQPDAEKRISEVFGAAQQAADTARKIVAHSLLWAFLALLIGAFCASLAGTIGGRQRDHVMVVSS